MGDEVLSHDDGGQEACDHGRRHDGAVHRRDVCSRPSRLFEHWLANQMEKLARAVAGRPRITALLPVVVCLIIAIGIIPPKYESRYENLWYPRHTQSWTDLNLLWDTFGMYNRSNIMVVEALKDGVYDGDVLQQQALMDVLELQESLTTRAGDTYADVCVRAWVGDDAPCTTYSLIDVFATNTSTIDAHESESESVLDYTPRSILADLDQSAILAMLSSSSLTSGVTGGQVYLPSLAGDIAYNETSGSIISARALQIVIPIVNQESQREDALKYERDEFIKTCTRYSVDGLRVSCLAGCSYQDESDAIIAQDNIFVQLAMCMMVVYVSIVLGDCHPVHSKVMLSLSIIVTIALSLAFAFGMGGWLGYPITQLSLMSVFILLGVGVDDMFIIVGAWRRASTDHTSSTDHADGLDDAERLAIALREVGASISLTSITDFTAFLIGSTIDIPAVKYFCFVAGFSVLAVFIIQLSFFTAMLLLDEQRTRAGKMDVLPCVVWKGSPSTDHQPTDHQPTDHQSTDHQPTDQKPTDQKTTDMKKTDVQTKGKDVDGGGGGGDDAGVLFGVMDRLASSILVPWRAALIVTGFIVMDALLGAYGLTAIQTGANWSDFLPEGSYVIDFYNARDRYFGQQGDLSLITHTVDVASYDDLEGMRNLATKALDLEHVLHVDSWFEVFDTWCETKGVNLSHPLNDPLNDDMSHHRDLLLQWSVNNSLYGGYRYQQHLVFNKDGSGVIDNSRLVATTTVPSDLDDQIDDMRESRRAVHKVDGVDAVAITQAYGWLSREEKMTMYTVQTLCGALIGVLIISLFFLEPWLALITVVSVALVNVCIFGVMALVNIYLNIVSLINLVLAIGFAVDYSAHIAEGYMVKSTSSSTSSTPSSSSSSSSSSSTSSAQSFMHEAMVDLGGSVLNGGLSTLLGVLFMAFSKSTAFQTLFRMFLAMVVFGLAHGLIFMPALIYLIAVSYERHTARTSHTSRAAAGADGGGGVNGDGGSMMVAGHVVQMRPIPTHETEL